MGFQPIWSTSKGISGKKKQARRKSSRSPRRSLRLESLEPRSMLAGGPQLMQILPNEGPDLITNTMPRSIAPTQLTLQFSAGQTIDAGNLNLGSIEIFRGGADGMLGTGDDVKVFPFNSAQPGFVGLGDKPNEVIVRFGQTLPDDKYFIRIFGVNGTAQLRNTAGDPFSDANGNPTDALFGFELDLGARVVAVVPEPVTRGAGNVLSVASGVVDVYFNVNDPLNPSLANNPTFYQLVATGNTATSSDDTMFMPTSVSYDQSTGRARLTFTNGGAPLSSLGTGTFRLRVGDDDLPATMALPETPVQTAPIGDPGSAYTSSLNIGGLTASGHVITAAIEPQPYPLIFPGGNDEPGHRLIPAEDHLIGGADSVMGVQTVYYDFRSDYGVTPEGNQLFNVITETQKQRVREIMEFYSHYLGIQFVESNPAPGAPSLGITIAVGDLRAVDPNTPSGPGGVIGISTATIPGLVVMDNDDDWGQSEFGGTFFSTAMHEVGHNLGLGHDTELPDLTVMAGGGALGYNVTHPDNFGEPIYPGDHDIVHGQHLHRPESKDIDLYQFMLSSAGTFSAETLAERLPDSSDLNTVLSLFGTIHVLHMPRQGGGNFISPQALNGQKFTVNDGFISWTFEYDNGDGVAAGNIAIPYSANDSAQALAARTQTVIHRNVPQHVVVSLQNQRLEFRGVQSVTIDTSSTMLLNPQPSADFILGKTTELGVLARNDNYFSDDSLLELHLGAGTYYVGVSAAGNASYDPIIDDSGIGGTTQGPYQLRLNFQPRAAQAILDLDAGGGTRLDGDGDGRPGGAFNYWFTVADAAHTVYVDKLAPNGGSGTINSPLNNLANPAVANNAVAVSNALANPNPNAPPVPTVVRVIGNGGGDGMLSSLNDNVPYAIGFDIFNNPLPDGTTFTLPRGVTFMVDAGAIFKLREANIDVGSLAQGVDKSQSALQVLGTPFMPVYFTSANDEQFGLDLLPSFPTFATPGDWGGIVFRNHQDYDEGRTVLETQGIFLNYVNYADMRYGGGDVFVDSVQQIFNPIHMVEARPTITNNVILQSADAAMSADPNSFLESRYVIRSGGINFATSGTPITITTEGVHHLSTGDRVLVNGILGNTAANGTWTITVTGPQTFILNGSAGNGPYASSKTDRWVQIDAAGNPVHFNLDYDRVGPEIHGNMLAAFDGTNVLNNTLNGLLVRVKTDAGRSLDLLEVAGRWDDTDITHILTENVVVGTPGGRSIHNASLAAPQFGREDGSLVIDPDIIVKVNGARIEAQISAQVVAEGSRAYPVIFTSYRDDRYGRGGTMDTESGNIVGQTDPQPGDWGGIFYDRLSQGSLASNLITFAGGDTRIEGGFDNFNPVEIHQARVRIADSIFEQNASGVAASGRANRGTNADTTIFIRGAQPVIVNNIIRNNAGGTINVNANSLNSNLVQDLGRSRGLVTAFPQFNDNYGPLIRGNRLANNDFAGMVVRGAYLTTETIWDDTDIVHIMFDEIVVTNHHTFSGLKLKSSATESLVVKLFGANAGFTANGDALDIDDRIGGTVQVVGTPQRPVIMTSLFDSTVGAGLDPDGAVLTATVPNAPPPSPGDWRSVRFEKFANDRNLDAIVENEATSTAGVDANGTPQTAQFLGGLATREKHSDENLRLGFHVNGFISLDTPGDVDVYSFEARAGTEVWIDLDRTTHALDSVIELMLSNGQVVARSNDSWGEEQAGVFPPLPGGNIARLMPRDAFSIHDLYTTNLRDAGMRVVLPGAPGTLFTYFVRVRSNSPQLDTSLAAGITRGAYQLQIRLREWQEVPGSTVSNSIIRFATDGVEVLGLPAHSPLTGDTAEPNVGNDTFGASVDVGNMLRSDRNSIALAGALSAATDVDFYRFTVDYNFVQSATGLFNVAFDIDYADGIARPDTTIAVFDANGNLLFIGRDSDVFEDQPGPTQGADTDDISRGTFGKLDPYIGAQSLVAGRTYVVAVMSNTHLPQVLDAYYVNNPARPHIRLEPVTEVARIVEDHIEFVAAGTTALNLTPNRFSLGDVPLFIQTNASPAPTAGTPGQLYYIDAFTGAIEYEITDPTGAAAPPTLPGSAAMEGFRDIAMRNDGRLFGLTLGTNDGNSGNYMEISTGDLFANGTLQTLRGDDGIQTYGRAPMATQPPFNAPSNRGIQFEALDFLENGNTRELFAVGYLPAVTTMSVFHPQTDNLLYELDPNTGLNSDDRIDPANFGEAGLQPSEQLPRAQLDVGTRGVKLTVSDAFDPLLNDGDTFVMDPDGAGPNAPITFEMDSGITLMVTTDASMINEGDSFSIQMVDQTNGQTIGGGPVIYYFDFDPSTRATAGQVPIQLNVTDTAAQVAAKIAAALLNPITPVDPTMTPPPNPLTGFLVGVHLSSVGQPDKVYLRELQPTRTFISANSVVPSIMTMGADGVTPGNVQIYFTPIDGTVASPISLADRIVFAFNAAKATRPTLNPINPVPMGNMVTFTVGGNVAIPTITIPAGTPFMETALANPGGQITGIDFMGGRPTGTSMFAVTDSGTILEYDVALFNPANNGTVYGGFANPNAIVPENSVNFAGISFSGLTVGPQSLDEDGDGVADYARILFATGTQGGISRLYAFDENLVPAPIFFDSATSVPLGVGSVRGIAFSPVDFNLWHVTGTRGGDLGHGINHSEEDGRVPLLNPDPPNGTLSYHFGIDGDSPQFATLNFLDPVTNNTQVGRSYNVPGGAYGSLTSGTFSLAGYTATDKPTLYFNYFLQTENANSAPSGMRDSFRVFISNDGANWNMLGTNNSLRDEELPANLSPSGGLYRNNAAIQRRQELFDQTDPNAANQFWRQARIDLGDFAGLSNLRLRFDFSTAGTMNIGGATIGAMLHMVPGGTLRDGQTFVIDGQTFEVDSGFTLIVPAGAGVNIPPGETFTLNDGFNPPVTFEFTTGGPVTPGNQPILINPLDSAETVALAIEQAISLVFLPFTTPGLGGITPRVNGNRVNLESDLTAMLTQSVGAVVGLQGSPGVTGTNARVAVHEQMTANQVAIQVSQAIDAVFSPNDAALPASRLTSVKRSGPLLYMIGSNVTNPGPLVLSTGLQGDNYGNFFTRDRARNNRFDGAFIDDIIVGFAERGELATGWNQGPNGGTALPAIGTGFFSTAAAASENLIGAYQLEIRRGTEDGFRTFIDTNDRLTQDFALTIPAGTALSDGQTIAINDGLNTVRFEFDANNSVTPGNVRIPFTAADSAATMAARVVAAINADPTLSTLSASVVSGDKVQLVGAADVTSTGPTGVAAVLTEDNDTIATAFPAGNVAGGFVATGAIGDSLAFPTLDVDLIEVNLTAGQRMRVDIDAEINGSSLDSMLRIFDAAGTELAFSDDDPAPGEVFTFDSYLDFVAPATGVYYIGVSSFVNFFYDPNVAGSGALSFTTGPYTLEINISSLQVQPYDNLGDENQFREQGQIVIQSSHISDFSGFGIRVDASARDGANLPHIGSVRNTRELNDEGPGLLGYATGAVIMNNLITNVGTGGILFSGDPNPAGQAQSPLIFGRIVNNTIYGANTPTGVGILVDENGAPTILNNILANLTTGIQVNGAASRDQVRGTVLGANLYQNAPTNTATTGNTINGGIGSFGIVLQPTDPLFVDAPNRVFTLQRGSRAIDASIDSLIDRVEITTVKNPLDIGQSPILAPRYDLNGIIRQDDPTANPPPGMGVNVFKDRGALERVDVPRITINDVTVMEGNGPPFNVAVFTVRLGTSTTPEPSSEIVTVEFTTNNGTANGGVDYANTSGTVTFLPGETAKPVSVTIIGDTVFEGNETFQVNLFNPTKSVLLDSTGIGTITEDDPGVGISISDATALEGNVGQSNQMVFTVSISGFSGSPITVDFATADGTATGGVDYTPTMGQITFAANSTASQRITVNLIGDAVFESNETFFVNLSNATAPTQIADPQGLGTIIEDEPSISIVPNVTISEGNTGTKNMLFPVTLSQPITGNVTVNFTTNNGSAVAGADFTAVSGVLTFVPGGPLTQNITVPIIGDTLIEGNENFTVVLSNVVGAGSNNLTSIGTIVDDDTLNNLVTGADAGGGPHVRVFDPGSGFEKFGFFAYAGAFTGGVRVATGDVNGDGVEDIITGPGKGGGPHIRVWNGVNGAPLTGPTGSFFAFAGDFTGGVYVAAGDANLDGRADIFVSTQGNVGENARMRVFDGVTGAILRDLAFDTSSSFNGGLRVGTGDINGDGRADAIMGNGPGRASRIMVVDVASGATLRDFAPYGGFTGGVFVTSGDINGDGRDDIVAGADAGGGPLVLVFDGPTNTTIRGIYPYAPAYTGGTRVATADVNNDGFDDIITSPGRDGGPHVRIFSGQDPSIVFGNIFAYNAAFTGGVFVSASGSGSPLRAWSDEGTAAAESLTQEQLQPIVEEAIARLSKGLDASQIEKLRSAKIRIADLAPGYLGLAKDGAIYIDVNAAGNGWFVDSTPQDDDEFAEGIGSQYDLLSAVMHEMGHLLGLPDLDESLDGDDLMSEFLHAGERAASGHSDLDAVFSELGEEGWL